jgi:osmotically-inducible protein OsmY
MDRYDPDYSRRRRYDRDDDRGFFDRASDEVRSWFGDDDAERRRDRDHRYGRMDDRYGARYENDRYGEHDFEDEDARRASRRYRPGYGRSDYGNRYGRSDYGGARSDADRYADDYRTAGFGARPYQEGYGDSGYSRDPYGRRSTGSYSGGSYDRGDRSDYDRYGRSRSYDRDAFRSGDDYSSRFGRSTSYDRDTFGADRNRYDGPHSGVGPSGYSRSKDRIEEDVNERLKHHGQLDATHIRVSVDDDGDVTLEGTVGSRREKRLADDVAESVRGVDDVHNRLRIERSDQDRSSMTSGSTGTAGATGSARTGEGTRQTAAAS